jgi:hypothetical protein
MESSRESSIVDRAVFEFDQAPSFGSFEVKLDLHVGVGRAGLERAGEIVDEAVRLSRLLASCFMSRSL